MREFFNNIKTQIAIMDASLFFALLSLLAIIACMFLINMIKSLTKSDYKIKFQLAPFIVFLLVLALIVLLAVCRFA